MERAFHVPGLRFGRERVERFGGCLLAVADPSPEEIRSLVAALRAGSPRPRGGLRSRARALAAAAARFLDPDDPIRRRALEALPSITGFSPAMIEAALARIFSVIDERSIESVAGSAAAPVVPLLGVVSAGNIPGVALPQAVLALSAGSSCVVKTASGEPLLMPLFAEALGEVAPDVAASLAVVWWRGGSVACERALAGGADSLVVYGSDAAVGAWSSYGPRRLVPHGHRASVAVVRLVDHPAKLASLAAAAAADVVMYDQLGCLSPQCLFTIGGAARDEFVRRLADALDAEERRLPRGVVPEDDATLIRRLRDEFEWREIRGEPVTLVPRAEPARWTIVVDDTPEFRPSPLYRTIVVRPVASAADLPRAIGAWLPRIESAGIGPWPDPEVLQGLAAVPRRVPLGTMQSPDLGWRQGGVEPMAAIIDEESA